MAASARVNHVHGGNEAVGYPFDGYLDQYAPAIQTLRSRDLDSYDRLAEHLLVEREGALSVLYAPFEFVNPNARVVIVGITPGFQQMRNALVAAREALGARRPMPAVLEHAKRTGAFSGPLRKNLVRMLDEVGVARGLGLSTSADLFGQRKELLQSTSALMLPVFRDGKNYNGSPGISSSPMLNSMLHRGLGSLTESLPADAIYIPLGDKVSEALYSLARSGSALREEQVLDGLPHPSGANAERIKYFLGEKPRSALSSKTNPDRIDAGKSRVLEKIRLVFG